jgi:L-2,4-diaminobutyric acid acetyltransferase
MLICTHFRQTSIVLEQDGDIKGLVSGYFDPDIPNTLFVWQVAVDISLRGKGVALQMLKKLLSRDTMRSVRFIDTTISPSNAASQNLFKRLSSVLNVEVKAQPYFKQELFGGEAHEDEELYRIGPFINHLAKEKQ